VADRLTSLDGLGVVFFDSRAVAAKADPHSTSQGGVISRAGERAFDAWGALKGEASRLGSAPSRPIGMTGTPVRDPNAVRMPAKTRYRCHASRCWWT